jgi:hypothetical protein
MKVLQQFSLPGYFMSGKVIEFRGRNTNRASLYRAQAVPRPDGQAVLGLQIARITGLLDELEDLIGSADGQSSPLLQQARSTVERTRRVLAPRAKLTTSAGLETYNEGDPQPDVDRALLERMYRDLNPIA